MESRVEPLFIPKALLSQYNNRPMLPVGYNQHSATLDIAMRIMKPYEYEPGLIGLDCHKNLPFTETPEANDGLDAIADACERGMLQRSTWVLQCFSTVEMFHEFIENLAECDQYSRIHDRWYQALMELGDTVNEEGFVTSSEIAERLVDCARETGQIESQ